MRISDFTSPRQGALSLMPHHKHTAEFYCPESHIQISMKAHYSALCTVYLALCFKLPTKKKNAGVPAKSDPLLSIPDVQKGQKQGR